MTMKKIYPLFIIHVSVLSIIYLLSICLPIIYVSITYCLSIVRVAMYLHRETPSQTPPRGL